MRRVQSLTSNQRRTTRLATAGLAITGLIYSAQSLAQDSSPAKAPDPSLTFEVASIRRVDIPNINGGVPVFFPEGGIGTSSPRRISYHGAQLMGLIGTAFGVEAEYITAPEWLRKERYDIVANIPEGATKEQFNVMMGNLFKDRFHLTFHLEPKTVPVYVLHIGKNGPKFKETVAVPSDPTKVSRAMSEKDALGFIVVPPDYHGAISQPRDGEMFLTAQDVPISMLAGALRRPGERRIVDETGLTGNYDFKVRYEWIRRASPNSVAALDSATSIFTAVDDQLGLKLETGTRSFPQMVIDSMDREPTEN